MRVAEITIFKPQPTSVCACDKDSGETFSPLSHLGLDNLGYRTSQLVEQKLNRTSWEGVSDISQYFKAGICSGTPSWLYKRPPPPTT